MTTQSTVALLRSGYAHILHHTPAFFEEQKIELYQPTRAPRRGALLRQDQSLRMGSTHMSTFYTRRYINCEATISYSRNLLLLQGGSRSSVGCVIGDLGRQGFVQNVHRFRIRNLDITESFPLYLRYCSG
jgi:hypothetical protein